MNLNIHPMETKKKLSSSLSQPTLFKEIPLNSEQCSQLVKRLNQLEHKATTPQKLEEQNRMMITDANSFLVQENNRTNSQQQTEEENRKIDQWIQIMLLALQSGHLEIAMLIFSQIESKSGKDTIAELTKTLLKLQENRRQISQALGAENSKKKPNQATLYDLQSKIQDTNDTIQLLTSFIKDVSDQKNRTLEFAQGFIASENQTSMNIARGMRG